MDLSWVTEIEMLFNKRRTLFAKTVLVMVVRGEGG